MDLKASGDGEGGVRRKKNEESNVFGWKLSYQVTGGRPKRGGVRGTGSET